MELFEIDCALCEKHLSMDLDTEEGIEAQCQWYPEVFVGSRDLGCLCPECGKKYEVREVTEEDGAMIHNDQLGKVFEAFKDYPKARERLRVLPRSVRDFLSDEDTEGEEWKNL